MNYFYRRMLYLGEQLVLTPGQELEVMGYCSVYSTKQYNMLFLSTRSNNSYSISDAHVS